jgi:hypothetical protein
MICLNITLPPTSGSPQWYLSLRFSRQNPVHTSPLPTRATCLPISLISIISPAQYWVRVIDHGALHLNIMQT